MRHGSQRKDFPNPDGTVSQANSRKDLPLGGAVQKMGFIYANNVRAQQTAWSNIPFTNVNYDPSGLALLPTGFKIREDGFYLIWFGGSIAVPSNPAVFCQVRFAVNGTALNVGEGISMQGGTNPQEWETHACYADYFVPGDEIGMQDIDDPGAGGLHSGFGSVYLIIGKLEEDGV